VGDRKVSSVHASRHGGRGTLSEQKGLAGIPAVGRIKIGSKATIKYQKTRISLEGFVEHVEDNLQVNGLLDHPT